MCGRVVQVSDPLRFAFVEGLQVPDSRAKPPSYNVAPSQLLYVIREKHQTGKRTLELLRWGLIPHGCKEPRKGGASRSTPVPNPSRGFRHFAPLMQSAAASCPSIVFLSGARSKARGQSNPSPSRWKTARHSRLAVCGRTGVTRKAANGFARWRLSPCRRTSWSRKSTIVYR